MSPIFLPHVGQSEKMPVENYPPEIFRWRKFVAAIFHWSFFGCNFWNSHENLVFEAHRTYGTKVVYLPFYHILLTFRISLNFPSVRPMVLFGGGFPAAFPWGSTQESPGKARTGATKQRWAWRPQIRIENHRNCGDVFGFFVFLTWMFFW